MTSLSLAKPFLNSETMCKTIFCNLELVTTNLSSSEARTEGVKLAEESDGTKRLDDAFPGEEDGAEEAGQVPSEEAGVARDR